MTMALTILIMAVLLGAVGQIALKTGVNQLGPHPPPLLVLKSILTPWILIGFLAYGISSLLWLVAISRLDLSYAYPMLALGYVVVAFLSWKFLHEPMSIMRIAGLAIVCLGVVVVALSYRCQSPTANQCPPTAIHSPAPLDRTH